MQKLDQVEAFSAFLDFLANPKEYQDLIKDIKKESKARKELIEKERRIKDIDGWRAQEEKRLNQRSDDLDVREKSHLDNVSKLESEKSAQKKRVADSNKRLLEREKAIDVREADVSKLEKEKEKLLRLQQESQDERRKLQEAKDALKAKEAQLKAVMGG